MGDHPSILEVALAYLSAGLCALPAIRAEKRPAVGPWKQYQQRLPTPAECSAWMATPRKCPDALCILCGAASNNVEMLDFDGGGELFSAWWDCIPADLRDRLVVERTPSGGWHVIYRCIVAVCGNMKLAQRHSGGGEKVVTLIETRGEGGLFLCAPTAGYEITQGDLIALPVLTEAERDVLLQAAWDMNECPPPVAHGSADNSNNGGCPPESAHLCHCPSDNGHSRPMSVDISRICGLSADDADIRHGASHNAHITPVSADPSHSRSMLADNADRPGDDFNIRGNVRAILQQHGWVRLTDRQGAGGNEYWRRPDKDARAGGWSATLKECSDGLVFYVFSSNAAPFEPQTGYAPFAVYALLEHGGDFEQAARSLRTLGYGGQPRNCPTHNADGVPGADISAICGLSAAPGACPSDISHISGGGHGPANNTDSGLEIQSLKALITGFTGLNRPIIHELLRECETMNVIASPKMGKSWFVSRLAISVASGLDWLGLTVEPGRVLHIDNELHENTIVHRYRVISEAMDFPHHLYSGNIDMVSLRGRLRDLYGLAGMFEQIEAGQYKLVILDAFYRTLPRDTDENDNGAIANLYNLIDHYASRLQCAFVLIHHSSKGNQSGKAVTDVGAGAGSQSRAADTHLILRPHEEDGIVVLESAVRSWPPMAPRALKWDWPLFTPTDEVDTSALLGMTKPSKPKATPIEDFVEQCIATSDPCSKRSVLYEANQRLGLSERKAEEMLDLAMERGLASRIRAGSAMVYVKNRPGLTGDKALWTGALLARQPDASAQDIADEVGVSERYVRQIRAENKGLTAELDFEPELTSSGTSSANESCKH
ncbi:MAG: AAA family ATPase [Phycisphaeraceae bacterium]|nr:AAA family ATPase [Phycisphaeraceae bacterium]